MARSIDVILFDLGPLSTGIRFARTVDSDAASTPRALTAKSNRPIVFNGAVGGRFALAALTTRPADPGRPGEPARIDDLVRTTGDQTYGTALVLGPGASFEAGGSLAFDGPVHEAITRYRCALADDDDAPRQDGAVRTGSGEARLARARLVSVEGEERDRFLAGEPFGLEVTLTGAVTAPSLHLELRDGSGLLVAEELVDTASLGWDERDGGLELRLDVPAPPLEFGRFDLGLALVARDGRLLDRLPRGLPLLVYPEGEGRGLVRLEGTWRSAAKDPLR